MMPARGPGADHLQGSSGDDGLFGDDPRVAAVAPDVLLGGAGSDGVAYTFYAKPVVVDFDGAVRDDGQAGEGDTVGADVEHLSGGAGNDTLTGNNGGNSIDGWKGDDVLRGLDGPDVLYAYDGRDVVHGDDSDDEIYSVEENEVASAADQVDGGANDALGDKCESGRLDTVTGCER
jgi:serralysin